MVYLVYILNAFGGGVLINSIVSRHNRLVPYSKTEICIIRSATKLFLENGYTKTTLKMVEADSGMKTGNITYDFHSKEDLFKGLIVCKKSLVFLFSKIQEILRPLRL